jgi:hypothetical protein
MAHLRPIPAPATACRSARTQFWQRRPEGLDFCVSRDEPMVVYYEQVLLIVENLRLLNSVEWQVSIYGPLFVY